MSSRNARLSHKDRSQAGKLHSTMLSVVRSTEVLNAVAAAKLKLEKCGFELEYLALVDGISMQPSLRPKASNRLIVAANFGGVRLIDNVSLGDSWPWLGLDVCFPRTSLEIPSDDSWTISNHFSPSRCALVVWRPQNSRAHEGPWTGSEGIQRRHPRRRKVWR